MFFFYSARNRGLELRHGPHDDYFSFGQRDRSTGKRDVRRRVPSADFFKKQIRIAIRGKRKACRPLRSIDRSKKVSVRCAAIICRSKAHLRRSRSICRESVKLSLGSDTDWWSGVRVCAERWRSLPSPFLLSCLFREKRDTDAAANQQLFVMCELQGEVSKHTATKSDCGTEKTRSLVIQHASVMGRADV